MKAQLSHEEFEKAWFALSDRGRALVRERAEAFNMTLWQVMNTWPQYREG